MAATRTGQQVRLTESEALIESSFRRLLAAIESERERIRSGWQEVETEGERMHEELERTRQDTEEYCDGRREDILRKWKEVDEMAERMSVRLPDTGETLPINCSGTHFVLQKSALRHIEGSLLNHMFSDSFIKHLPRDAENNYFLDFNPICFGYLVQYLQRLMHRHDSPLPNVPPEHQMNMDLLVEALHIRIKRNRLQTDHTTSLRVTETTIEAVHDGWQIVAAQLPLPMSGVSYFEVKVLANPTSKGGLGVGICGHIPQGTEVHHIRLKNSVVYSSHNGLLGGNVAVDNVQKGIALTEGCSFGVKHDVGSHSLTWYHNKVCIGTCVMKQEVLENFRAVYPVFALFEPGQKLEVDFNASGPVGRHPPEPAEVHGT